MRDLRKYLQNTLGFMSLQAFVVAANFGGGLFLARGLPQRDRGAVAVTSIALGLSTIIAGAGLPEFSLVHAYVHYIKSRLTWLAAGWTLAVVLIMICVMRILHTASLIGGSMLGVATVLSVANLHLICRIQLSRGIKWVVRIRCIHAIASGALIGGISISVGLTRTNVYLAWAIAELVAAVAMGMVLSRSESCVSADAPSVVLTVSVGYALAQASGMFVDRGIVVIAAWAGGFGSAGGVTVFQNITAPIGIPVQTFSTAILTGGTEADQERTRAIRLIFWLAAAAAILGSILLPFLVTPLWGKNYAFIGRYSAIVCLSGFLLSVWRTQQLQLRAAKVPAQVLVGDLSALFTATLFAWSVGVDEELNICLLGLLFAVTGCVVSSALLARAQRRARQASQVELRTRERITN